MKLRTIFYSFIHAAILVAVLAAVSTGQSTTPPPGVEQIDLSDWVKENSKLGDTAFRAGKFYMRAKWPDRYYYVLVAPEDYSSVGRSTRVTLQNARGLPTQQGYGLVFHSSPEPLVQDYAFLIDTVTRRYRVVRHKSNNEVRVIKWTRSAFIKPGKRWNLLEVRDRGSHVDLYINRRFLRSIRTPFAYKGGQPGLYTDSTPIAFKDFNLTASDGVR